LSTTLTVGIVTPHHLSEAGVETSVPAHLPSSLTSSTPPEPIIGALLVACRSTPMNQHTPHVATDIRAARVLYCRYCLCCEEGFSSAFCG